MLVPCITMNDTWVLDNCRSLRKQHEGYGYRIAKPKVGTAEKYWPGACGSRQLLAS